MQNSISVIFPMYNELEYVEETISETSRILDSLCIDYEIIIIDDASTDGSGQKAMELARHDSSIKIFHLTENKKLGEVLKMGFSKATKDIIVYSDFDLPFDLSILNELIPLMGDVDIIQGYRIGKRESIHRTIFSKIYNFLVRLIFGSEVNDINFAMKIFKRQILENIKLKSKGPFIATEFIIKGQYLGYKIKELKVKYRPRKYSASRLFSSNTVLTILFEMIKFYSEIKVLSRKQLCKL